MNEERFKYFKNLYEVMGVPYGTSIDDIKKVYKKMAKENHEDILRQQLDSGKITQREFETRNERFKNISAAYDVLSNKDKKTKYDREYTAYMSYLQEKMEREMAEERRRREAARKARTERRESRTRRTQSTTRETEAETPKYKTRRKSKKGFMYDLKTSINEVRKDEAKKEHSNISHKNIENNVKKEFKNVESTKDFITLQLRRGVAHIAVGFYNTLNNLSYITKDNIVKYTIRNRRLAALVLAGVISVNGANLVFNNTSKANSADTVVAEQNIEEELEEEVYIPSKVTLNRRYTIRGGDTLTDLEQETGTSVRVIQSLNNIEEASRIQMGQKIIIPYVVSKDDLAFYEYVVDYDNSMSLEEFAIRHNTDVETLRVLNPEAIETTYGVDVVLSDCLYVPKFVTQEELKDIKESKVAKY